jgi:dipeptidyl aminopeptidase/acylaminoacyl peptidase
VRFTAWSLVHGVLGGLLGFGSPVARQNLTTAPQKRLVTVADGISAARVVGTPFPYYSPDSGFAVFSPNNKFFAVVVSKGDLEHNTNDYSLLVFRTDETGHQNVPKKLATFACSSNSAGISEIKWTKDSDTILFLGSNGSEPTQIYSVRYNSRQLKKLTNHRESILSYAFSENDDRFVYAAERPARDLIDTRTSRTGFYVGSEPLSGLVSGRISSRESELFLKTPDKSKDTSLRTHDPFDSGLNDLFLSPNGLYALVKTDTTRFPEHWRQYDDENIRNVLRRGLPIGSSTRILHFELIDLRTGRSEVLLDAPTTYSSSDVLWSPDSRSVLLCETYLPLDVQDPVELQARRTHKFVVEIRVGDRQTTKITDQNLEPLRWNSRTGIVEFNVADRSLRAGDVPERVYYRKFSGGWERLASAPDIATDALPRVFVDEDMNAPPRIVMAHPQTKQETEVLDLNPQFAALSFGKEQEIHWESEGVVLNGGLYLPPNYVSGKRYPLVIQTHGFDPHRFWMDGPYSSAFAAQPLASRGIAVLQMNDLFSNTLETPQEPMRVLGAYRSVIEYLDAIGVIDPEHVGLVGFSRTCMYVKYALTHLNQHFDAAVVADGVDAGYFQYLMFYSDNPIRSYDAEAIVGSAPFGDGLSLWIKDSPGFLLDKVKTPLLIQAIGPSSILGEWQWLQGLKRLGKPVEMVYLPAGVHILAKPWEQAVSQQGTVDWFCFWLKHEEDPDPAKAEQYRRWRNLRDSADTVRNGSE